MAPHPHPGGTPERQRTANPHVLALANAWRRHKWLDPHALGEPGCAWLTAEAAWDMATARTARKEWFEALSCAGAFERGTPLSHDQARDGMTRLVGFGRARSLKWALACPEIRAALGTGAGDPWGWWDRCAWAATFSRQNAQGAARACLRALIDTPGAPPPEHIMDTLACCLNEAATRGRLDSVQRLLEVGAPVAGTGNVPPALEALLTHPVGGGAFRQGLREAWRIFDRLLAAGASLDTPGKDKPCARALGEALLDRGASAFARARWDATVAQWDAATIGLAIGLAGNRRTDAPRL